MPAPTDFMRAKQRNIGDEIVMIATAATYHGTPTMDDVRTACSESPAMARALVEGAGHRIGEMFLDPVA